MLTHLQATKKFRRRVSAASSTVSALPMLASAGMIPFPFWTCWQMRSRRGEKSSSKVFGLLCGYDSLEPVLTTSCSLKIHDRRYGMISQKYAVLECENGKACTAA